MFANTHLPQEAKKVYGSINIIVLVLPSHNFYPQNQFEYFKIDDKPKSFY